jgi:hypothetical protein
MESGAVGVALELLIIPIAVGASPWALQPMFQAAMPTAVTGPAADTMFRRDSRRDG